MKLYIDVDVDQPYLVTDDGESVYVDDLREDGRDTEYLDRTVEEVSRRVASTKWQVRPVETDELDPD
jgi:hypothetical protein